MQRAGCIGGPGALAGRCDERGRNRDPPCLPWYRRAMSEPPTGGFDAARTPDITVRFRSIRPTGGEPRPSAGHGCAVAPSRPRIESPWVSLRSGRRCQQTGHRSPRPQTNSSCHSLCKLTPHPAGDEPTSRKQPADDLPLPRPQPKPSPGTLPTGTVRYSRANASIRRAPDRGRSVRSSGGAVISAFGPTLMRNLWLGGRWGRRFGVHARLTSWAWFLGGTTC
jgi:hypothetical protein